MNFIIWSYLHILFAFKNKDTNLRRVIDVIDV